MFSAVVVVYIILCAILNTKDNAIDSTESERKYVNNYDELSNGAGKLY